MWRDGRPIPGQEYYIQGKQRRYFYNVGIRKPIFPKDHWMIMAELKGEGSRRNYRYCKARLIWPIVKTKGGTIQEGDSQFIELKNKVKKPTRKSRVAASWI